MKIRPKHFPLACGFAFALSVMTYGCGDAEPSDQEDEEAQEDDDEEEEQGDTRDSEDDDELPDPDKEDEDDEDSKNNDGDDQDDASEDSSDGSDDTQEDSDTESKPKKPKDPGPKQDVCSETVPAKHYVDEIPAYSQCAQSLNAKIWSNDGIRTATSSQGDGWVPTQWGGGYQCTEFAKRYMYFRFGVEKFPNGNAGVWCEGATPEGLEKNSDPVHGDLIIFGPGACGASLATGHVGVVDKVDKDKGMVEFVEQNQANRRVCAISTAACFLHAKSNK